jgi:hypothetical protein
MHPRPPTLSAVREAANEKLLAEEMERVLTGMPESYRAAAGKLAGVLGTYVRLKRMVTPKESLQVLT